MGMETPAEPNGATWHHRTGIIGATILFFGIFLVIRLSQDTGNTTTTEIIGAAVSAVAFAGVMAAIARLVDRRRDQS